MTLLTEPTRIVLAKGQPVPNDPYLYTNTVLLLHGDGTNGSTTILDSSKVAGSPKTVTAVGNAQISTAQSKFGGSSLFFNNSIANRIGVTPTTDLAFGTENFTVEGWIYQTSQPQYSTFLEIGNHQNATGIVFLVGTASANLYSGAFFGTLTNSTLNQWVHVAWCRSMGTLRAFNNGLQIASVPFTNNLTDTSQVTVGYPAIGGSNLAFYTFDGYIDDLRITKGIARYTANFSVPTAPFPDF